MVKDGMVGDDLRDLKECKGQIRVFLAHTHTHTKKLLEAREIIESRKIPRFSEK